MQPPHGMMHRCDRSCITTSTSVCGHVDHCGLLNNTRNDSGDSMYQTMARNPQKVHGMQLPHEMTHQRYRSCITTPLGVCVIVWIKVVWKITHAMNLWTPCVKPWSEIPRKPLECNCHME